jgi:hypothetical protein
MTREERMRHAIRQIPYSYFIIAAYQRLSGDHELAQIQVVRPNELLSVQWVRDNYTPGVLEEMLQLMMMLGGDDATTLAVYEQPIHEELIVVASARAGYRQRLFKIVFRGVHRPALGSLGLIQRQPASPNEGDQVLSRPPPEWSIANAIPAPAGEDDQNFFVTSVTDAKQFQLKACARR